MTQGLELTKILKQLFLTLFRDKRIRHATNERKNTKFQQSKTIGRTKRKP